VVSYDADLIALVGTELVDGYIVRDKDYQDIERTLNAILQHLRRA
jgi:hypothetical protein